MGVLTLFAKVLAAAALDEPREDAHEVGTGRTAPTLYQGRPVEAWLAPEHEPRSRGLFAKLLGGRR